MQVATSSNQLKLDDCEVCNGLRPRAQHAPRIALDFRPKDLDASRCASCALLLEALRYWTLTEKISRVYGYGSLATRDTFWLEVYFSTDEPKLCLEFFEIDIEGSNGGPSLPWKAIKSRSSVCGDPLSPQLMKWVSSRIDDCVGRHSLCQPGRKIKSTPFFPKRILQLNTTPTGQVIVRLVEEELPGVKYAALSHCWGPSLKCTTMTANLSIHKDQVPWNEMPLTFQEAILFCLQLGIFHLWIDALCILQDDPEDWQTQSSQMAEIYQRSHVTLAATSSKSGSAGCFPKPDSPPERQIRVEGPAGQLYRVMVRKKIAHWAHPLPNPARESFPLLTRGWAFQERILAPRVLHFCQSELVWECNEEVICECGSLLSMDGIKNKFSRISNQAQAMPLKEIRVAEEIVREGTVATASRTVAEPPSQRQDTPRGGGPTPDLQVFLGSRDLARYTGYTGTSQQITGGLLPNSSEIAGEPSSSSRLNPPLSRPRHRHRQRKGQRISRPRTKEEARALFRSTHEPHPVHYADSPMTGSQMPDFKELTELKTTGTLSGKQHRALQEWHKIVEHYSNLQLTRETDRLPALSGLATRTASFLGQYLAGLWSYTFLKNLAWRVDLLASTSRRPTKYQGPSWSWVSINTGVTYFTEKEWNSCFSGPESYRQNKTKKLMTPHVEPAFKCVAKAAGRNPFGEVASAALVAKGLLRTATLTQSHTIMANGTTVPLTYQAKICLPETTGKNAPQGSVEMPFWADYALTRYDAGRYRVSLEGEIYLFLIYPNVCLVLAVAGEVGSTKIYNRIGIIKQLYIYPEMYEIDWMKEAELVEVTIV